MKTGGVEEDLFSLLMIFCIDAIFSRRLYSECDYRNHEKMSAPRMTTHPKLKERVILLHGGRGKSMVLCTVLAGLLGALPLIQIGHLLFADHGHRYCSEHHQVEDIPRISGLSVADVATIASTSIMHAENYSFPHSACSFLNHSGSRDSLNATGTAIPADSTPAGATWKSVDRQAAVQCSLLHVAPKTSPPFTTV